MYIVAVSFLSMMCRLQILILDWLSSLLAKIVEVLTVALYDALKYPLMCCSGMFIPVESSLPIISSAVDVDRYAKQIKAHKSNSLFKEAGASFLRGGLSCNEF